MTDPTSANASDARMRLSRKRMLAGMGGFVLGVPFGAFGRKLSGAPRRGFEPKETARSYSQAGEDAVADFFFCHLKLGRVTYLDIGAHDPIDNNNTYLFYRKGFRGVLVEPNVAMTGKLRRMRPEDTTLVAGIGVQGASEADYYVMNKPTWNTFSQEEAEHVEQVTKGKVRVLKVVKMPLLNVNDVMREHFGKAPSYLSVDAEGWHLAILKSIDFDHFRPPLICAETLVSGTSKTISEIPEFMASRDYVPRGGSFVNTLFADSRIL